MSHPVRAIREPFGKAGLTVAILALIFAMVGGAYAASGLTGKQKKEVEKIAKKVAKPGKPGPAGATGPAGSAGPIGAAGANGAGGAPGATGKEGKQGKEGITGFASELPAGETETGSFALGRLPVEQFAKLPISFPFPLPEGEGETGKEVNVTYLKEGEGPTSNCPGTPSEPAAEPGNMCVYETEGFGVSFTTEYNPENNTGEIGAGRTGVILEMEGEEFGFAVGTWAVTARN